MLSSNLLMRLLVVALAYYLAGRLGLSLASFAGQVTLIWPPTGVAMFALLVWGARLWPAVWLAAFLLNLPLDTSIAGSLTIATGNTLGPLGAALALNRLGFDYSFPRYRDVIFYLLIASLGGMALNATVGSVTLVIDGVVPTTIIHQVWLTWWLGDALGALIIGPALLTLFVPSAIRLPGRHSLEVLLTWAGVLLIGLLAVTPLTPFPDGLPPMLPFPFVIWLALRQSPFHAAWATLVVSGMALWGAMAQWGPFVDAEGRVVLSLLWSYMFVLGMISLLITALHTESTTALVKTRSSEQRLKDAQRIAHIGHWELDLVTSRLSWSDEVFRIFEIDPKRFGGSYGTFLDAIHPDDRAGVDRAYQESVEQRKPYEISHRLLMEDGRVKYVRERGRTSYEQGQPLRSIGTVHDITQEWETAEALQRNMEAAKAADQAKSEFLTTMSHEIRSPMNVVIGMSELLLNTPLSDEQRQYIDALQHSGTTLLDLINDILDFSKLEAEALELNLAGYDPAELVVDLLAMFEPRARQRGVALRMEIRMTEPQWVLGDVRRVRQVLLNLIGNALKFTEEGQVTVRLAGEVVADREMMHFSIADTGVGIVEEQLERVFEKFSQADSSVTRRFGGTGLGLAISKRLVELMDGRIWVESEPGSGSTFHVTLPLVEGREPPARDTTEPRVFPEVEQRPLKILLAEDSEDNQRLIKAYLKGTPHTLEMVMDGEQALVRIRENPCDLILMDIQMPVMDGYSATRAIRAVEQEEGRIHTPILALTAHALQGDKEKSLAAGCDGHLTKPIKKARLLEAIAEYARRK